MVYEDCVCVTVIVFVVLRDILRLLYRIVNYILNIEFFADVVIFNCI